jgi:two-component system, cell cycle response regulator
MDQMARGRVRLVRYLLFTPLALVTVAVIAYLAGVDFGPLEQFMARWSALILEAGGAVACLARVALVRRERLAWSLLATGVVLWVFGDTYCRAVLLTADSVPIPSLADAGWLSFYPFAYAAIFVLIRDRARHVRATVWFDGLIAALAVAAAATAIVFNAVVSNIGGDPLATATNLAYPLAEGLLLALLVAAFAITGWRLDRTWCWLAAALCVFAVSDSIYLVQVAQGTYTPGGVLDFGWALALVLVGASAWSLGDGAQADSKMETWRSIILPILFGCVAIAIETYDHFTRITGLALGLASACLAAVLGRLAITFAQNLLMLRTSQDEAATDPLTGLANRRQLTNDLDHILNEPDSSPAHVLMLLDLNGFKLYNDSFGHPAGDALLHRLGVRLADEVDGLGSAYRMGGDEFCALFPLEVDAVESVVPRVAAALSDHGDGFAIGCSYGWIILPADAKTPEAALQLVDQRMYAQKESGRSSARAQSKDVLLQALVERSPNLGPHLRDVADLAARTAEQLGLDDQDIDRIHTAGELHDIGKVAIPDAILDKPGPLDEAEWEYIKRHSAVGERIVGAAPALASVASLVRSVHERLDGGGYPDGLTGTEIPMGARVLAVCDSYAAMTADRPYRATMEQAAATAELRRCVGSQFDGEVVEAFCRVLDAEAIEGLRDKNALKVAVA